MVIILFTAEKSLSNTQHIESFTMDSSPPPPVAAETLLSVTQGDILAGGIPKKNEAFLFFNIQSPKDFCQILHLETTLDLFSTGKFVANRRTYIRLAKTRDVKESFFMAIANISFSATGLTKARRLTPKMAFAN